MVGEAVQRLMEVCLKAGSVSLVLRSEALWMRPSGRLTS